MRNEIKLKLRTDGKGNENGEFPIYMQYSCIGQAVKHSTGIWVNKESWKGGNNRPIKSTHPKANQLNSTLMAQKGKIDAILDEIFAKNSNAVITVPLMKSIFNGNYRQKQAEENGHISFISYVLGINESLYIDKKISLSVWENIKCNMKIFQKYLSSIGKKDLLCVNVTTEIIQGYKAWRKEERENTNDTINKSLTPIFKAVKKMCNLGWISRYVSDEICESYYPQEKILEESEVSTEMHYLTKEQISQLKALYPQFKYDRTRDFIDIFMFSANACGLRISDVITLKWNNINMETHQLSKIMVKGHTRKTNRLKFKLNDSAMQILEKWCGRYNDYVFGLLPDGFNLDNEKELRLSINRKTRLINTSLKAIGKRMELPYELHFHVARHTFAVTALNIGTDVHKLSTLMGHASSMVTERVYAKYLPETLDDEVNKIEI